MLKKGNKQQFRDLNIPVTENLAANIRDKQVAEREEHEEMKRLVLGYNQRQEEEAFNGTFIASVFGNLEKINSLMASIHGRAKKVSLIKPIYAVLIV